MHGVPLGETFSLLSALPNIFSISVSVFPIMVLTSIIFSFCSESIIFSCFEFPQEIKKKAQTSNVIEFFIFRV
ncbi:hypothetical protein D3C86_1875080 [compost metagenome]